MLAAVVVLALGSLVTGQAPKARLNPIIGLLEQKKPVFGLYAPSNRRFPGAPAAAADAPAKTPAELAKDALGYSSSDFVFDGSMEGDFERGYGPYSEFVKGLTLSGGIFTGTPAHRLHHPLVVKAPEIAPDAPGDGDGDGGGADGVTGDADGTTGDGGAEVGPPCSGDGGGPLVVAGGPSGFTQVGINSYGDHRCEGVGVFTRVSAFIDWIVRTTSASKSDDDQD